MNERPIQRLTNFIVAALLALGAALPLVAQQGQYHMNNSPFSTPDKPFGATATYSPIKKVDSETLCLRDNDGNMYTFTLAPDTVFCQGGVKVSDWTYLKAIGKKTSVTVLTNDGADKNVVVIWDKPPSITAVNGTIVFALPPMCK